MVTMLRWSSPNGLDHLERGCVDPKQHRRRLCGFDGDLIVMTAERGPCTESPAMRPVRTSNGLWSFRSSYPWGNRK